MKVECCATHSDPVWEEGELVWSDTGLSVVFCAVLAFEPELPYWRTKGGMCWSLSPL